MAANAAHARFRTRTYNFGRRATGRYGPPWFCKSWRENWLLDGGRRSEHVVDGHDRDGPEVQRLDGGLDRRAIAGDDDREPIGRDVLLRDTLHVGRGYPFNPLHVGGVVIVGQSIDERLLEAGGDVARGLEAERITQRDVVL